MEEKTYARHLKATDGRLVARYTAIDPADWAIRCTCDKPECARARLRPFREHVAELYRVLAEISQDQIADWDGVLYGLRMAASVEDVIADVGYVENPMTYALCEATIGHLEIPVAARLAEMIRCCFRSGDSDDEPAWIV